jgi:AMP phosphorylase
VDYIKRKLDGHELTTPEIRGIVEDISNNILSDIELSAYVSAIYMRGMTLREVKDMTLAMVENGETIEIDKKPVFDHHSIGGCPGNKVTLLVVPIAVAAGLTVPKTSSRAISSACGTADILETICNVTLSAQQIKNITETVGGVIAWGGGVNIAPADDLIIRAEYPLAIDPYAQVIASVMAKKKAVGAEYFLLDIPLGPETKVKTDQLARKYARDFIEIGRALDMEVSCAITYGGQPIGRAIGPAAEVREALVALEGTLSSSSLIEKALGLAGMLLEMAGVARPGEGRVEAKKFLDDGRALKKFQQIVEAQGGKSNISSKDVSLGEFTKEFHAREEGYVSIIHNKAIVKVVRAAGAPKDKGAGMILHKKLGDQVDKGEPLFRIHSDHEGKIENAWKLAQKIQPYITKGMILNKVTETVMTQGNIRKF